MTTRRWLLFVAPLAGACAANPAAPTAPTATTPATRAADTTTPTPAASDAPAAKDAQPAAPAPTPVAADEATAEEARDPDPAARALAGRCAARSGDACARLGDARLDAAPARAARLYERACDLGDASGCFGLGYVLAGSAPGAPHDAARARELFARACDAGHVNACSMLGLQYYWAHEVEVDRSRAAPLFEKACAAGEAKVACFNLALMHVDGALPGGEAAARPLLQRACDAGLGVACHDVALLSDRGRGAVTQRTADLFARACSLGYAASCEQATAAAAGMRATPSSGRRSPVPTVAEWEAAPALAVTGADVVGCAARALRDWLRVSCRGEPAGLGAPTTVEITAGGRTDTYRFAKGGVTSIVAPLVPGAHLEAELGWRRGHRTLVVDWPRGRPMPAAPGVIR